MTVHSATADADTYGRSVNTSRQYEIDLLREFPNMFMVVIHVYESLSIGFYDPTPITLTEHILHFFAGPTTAPAFIFALGTGVIYTRYNRLKDFFIRGLKLFLGGYLLNALRSGISLAILKATVRGKSKKVTWKSSDSSIASVSSSGVIKAKKKGTVTVIATANKASAKCKIIVVQSSIKLNRKSLTLVVGSSGKLTATVKGLSKVVAWSSSNSAVAAVSGGKITAKKKGTATIAAKANGKTAYCKITVKAKKADFPVFRRHSRICGK